MRQNRIQSLYDFFQYVLGLLSSGLAGLFFIGIFFSKVQTKSALTGFVGGTAILFWVSTNTNIDGFMYGFVGLSSTVLVAWIASLILNEPQKDLKGLTLKTAKEN